MVEISPLLLLSGVGMIALGVCAMAWWTPRTRFRFFLHGGALWAAAIAVKAAMDYTVTPWIHTGLSTTLGEGLPVWLTLGLYVGLRTGLLETGLPYLAAAKTRLRQAPWSDMLAVAMGFGAFEAIVLGAQSFLNVAAMIVDPGILDVLPAEQRGPIVKQLSYGALIVPLPVIERAFTLIAHVFATVLALYSAKAGKPSLLVASILYKTALDAPVPLMGSLTSHGNLVELYLSEAYVGAVALIGATSFRWFKSQHVDRIEAGHLGIRTTDLPDST